MNKQPTLFESDAYLKFKAYDAENPQIWNDFKKYTLEAVEKGFTHFSAEFVFNIIRWQTATRGSGEYKVNNNYKPWYSRKFMMEFPDHKGLFQLRKSKAEELEK